MIFSGSGFFSFITSVFISFSVFSSSSFSTRWRSCGGVSGVSYSGISSRTTSPNFLIGRTMTLFALRFVFILSASFFAISIIVGGIFGVSSISCFGIIRTWPFEAGMISRTARISGFSSTIVAGISFWTIRR